MCGILGVVAAGRANSFDESRFRAALATLHHRGPDGQQVKAVDQGVLFGHARLSIIDLSDASNQPFGIDDRYWLTYNGEIFNYLELRAELEALGARFETSGDTEVLLRAYIQWGPDCVSRFNGMWAFAIWDRQEKTLFASRDRFGIKPFNYTVVDGQLLFASEIKAMLACRPDLAEPDYVMIGNFCRTSVGAQHERTWFRRVKRLMPGHNLIWRDGQIALHRYWDYPKGTRRDIPFDEAVREYRALFEDAVRLRMRSDVPLGITLSSGVDSNSIIYVMQELDPSPHYCLTSRFSRADDLRQDPTIFADGAAVIDETVTAQRVAADLGLQSEVVDTDYDDLVTRMSEAIWHLESGNSAPAVIPLMQLLAHARKHMTVVMDGQGADELLGGYITAVFWPAQADLARQGRFAAVRAALREFRRTYTARSGIMWTLRYLSNSMPWIGRVQQKMSGLDALYGPRLTEGFVRVADSPAITPAGRGALARVLQEQHVGGLVNLLHYGDAVSMANSLESRVPFLDYRLVEYVWRLPGDYKVRGGVGKAIHRAAMRGLVPDDILDDRKKHGFTTPIAGVLRRKHPDGCDPLDLLLSERSLARGLFDRDGLTRVIAEHRSGKADHGTLLYRLLSTELWFRRFIDVPAPSVPEPLG